MRFSTIAAFATSLVVVSAQSPDLSSVPDCAIPCLVASIPASGCGVTDVKCQCTTGQASITKSLEGCIPSRCSTEDSAKVPGALAGICNAAGISVVIPSSVAAATSAAAATGASSAAASASRAVSSAASAASSRAASAAGSASTSAPAESTGGAVANAAGLGAVMLGAFVAAF